MHTTYTKFLIVFIGLPFGLFCQTNHGFSYDNYSGIYSTIANPANAVESKHRLHFNGVSYNRLGATDFGEVNFLDIEQNPNGFNGIDYPEELAGATNDNFLVSNSDILLPSVLWNFHPKHAIGLLLRSRSFSDYNGFNGQFWKDVNNDFTEGTQSNSFQNSTFNNTVHSWNEVGLNYAIVLLNTNYHFVKLGGTFKLLLGSGGAEFRGENLNGGYSESSTGNLSLESGEITYLNTQFKNPELGNESVNFLLSPFKNFSTKNTGIGGDVGLVYEWRPRETNNVGVRNNAGAVNTYKLRLSASILDMGTITYAKDSKDIIQNTFNINPSNNANINIPKSEVENIGFISALRNANISENNDPQQGAATFALPRSLNLGLDYILFNDKNYYVNINYVLPLTDTKEAYANTRTKLITLTPRYETRKLSIYLPVSYGADTGFFAGAGVRYGPVTLGTAALTGMFDMGNVRHVYVGINLPLLEDVFR